MDFYVFYIVFVGRFVQGSDAGTSFDCIYDQGMGNRGEVFITWKGFEPGTWSLELWDLK